MTLSADRALRWLDRHRADALDIIRIYLGAALFVKGIVFVANGYSLLESIGDAGIPFGAAIIAHYVIIAHIAGGTMLAIGLLPRVAALSQIPAVLGAIFYVHRGDRLFGASPNLQLEVLVLFLLVMFSLAGAGRISVEAWALPGRHTRSEGFA
jgi:putative oxidoreductase